MKKSIYTKIAFISLLIPISHIILFFVFMLLACLTEFPCERDGIYLVFAGIDIFLLLLFPVIQLNCSVLGIVFEIIALCKGESRIKNVAMLIASSAYIVLDVIFSYKLYLGMMSV